MFFPKHAFALFAYQVLVQAANTIDSQRFATTAEIQHLVGKICGTEPRLPGSDEHLKVVEFIKCQLDGVPGLTINSSTFDLAAWQPAGNSMYQAGRLKIEDEKIDIIGAMAYTLPTNGSYVDGELLYVPTSGNLSTIDTRGKIVIRDFNIPQIPTSIFGAFDYYETPDANATSTYTRPFLAPIQDDLLALSLGGAAGYISAINASRDQLEAYYSHHSGTHWLVPGVFTGADSYEKLIQAASNNQTASIRIDAKYETKQVPRLHAVLPGESNETIVLATHTDGVTYVQENGPAALLTLVRYFASLPKSARKKTIEFAFEASHLAYQLDSDKLLAKSLDARYDNANDTTAFVIAIEHLGSREIVPSPNASAENPELIYTGRSEALLWSVGPVQPAINAVIDIVKARDLNNTIVAPGFPPADDKKVPTYFSMGGLGTYYHDALVPTMATITGPWSLWAPGFGAEALDYDVLRAQHMAIGDAILALSEYSRDELVGNYTQYREQRMQGVESSTINYDNAQFITDPNAVYF